MEFIDNDVQLQKILLQYKKTYAIITLSKCSERDSCYGKRQEYGVTD